MPPIVVVSVIFTALLIASLPLIRLGVKRYIVHKAEQAQIVQRDPLLTDLLPGNPALVYFTSPGCGPCKLTQKPIIQKLESELGDNLQILTVDIEQRLDDALRWGVM